MSYLKDQVNTNTKMNFIPLLTPCSDTSLHSKQNANCSHDQQGHGWPMCPAQLHPGAYFLLTTEILHLTPSIPYMHRLVKLSHGNPLPGVLSSYPFPGWPLARLLSAVSSLLRVISLSGLLICSFFFFFSSIIAYNAVLLSGIQQCESVICIHISPSSDFAYPSPAHPLGHHRSSCAIQ